MKTITLTIPNDSAKLLVKNLELEMWRKSHENHPDPSPEDMWRWFHYHVVKWLQGHGADLLDR